jgi:hypothetical protein
LVFNFLKQKAIQIAHPQLRQTVQRIVADAEECTALMTENDLTNPETATAIFEQQQIVAAPPKPLMTVEPTDVVPVYNDAPPSARRKTALKKLD